MPDTAARIAAVVLAAGSSTRMGRNKMLLEIGGQPLVRRAVNAAIEAGLDPVLWCWGTKPSACARRSRGSTAARC